MICKGADEVKLQNLILILSEHFHLILSHRLKIISEKQNLEFIP